MTHENLQHPAGPESNADPLELIERLPESDLDEFMAGLQRCGLVEADEPGTAHELFVRHRERIEQTYADTTAETLHRHVAKWAMRSSVLITSAAKAHLEPRTPRSYESLEDLAETLAGIVGMTPEELWGDEYTALLADA